MIAGGAYYLGTQTQSNKQPAGVLSPAPEVSPTNQLVGADMQSDISESIKQALIKKNNWAKDMNLEVTISKREGIYVSGGVREKDTMAGGGYFFAVQDGGEWVIVADGNGVISCESVDLYPEYPSSLIPECWDEDGQKSIKR